MHAHTATAKEVVIAVLAIVVQLQLPAAGAALGRLTPRGGPLPPVASSDMGPVTWRAGAGTVTFDPARLSITSMAMARYPGMAADASQTPGPGSADTLAATQLFGVKLWESTTAASRASAVAPGSWALDAAHSDPPLRFAFVHPPAGLAATLTVTESPAPAPAPALGATHARGSNGSTSEGALLLRLELRNTRGDGRNLTLAEVAFPQLGAVRSTSTGAAAGGAEGPTAFSELVSGGGVRGTGLRVRNPGRNLSFPRLHCAGCSAGRTGRGVAYKTNTESRNARVRVYKSIRLSYSIETENGRVARTQGGRHHFGERGTRF